MGLAICLQSGPRACSKLRKLSRAYYLLEADRHSCLPTSSSLFTTGGLYLGCEGARWALNPKEVAKATYLGLPPYCPPQPVEKLWLSFFPLQSLSPGRKNTLEKVKARKSRGPQPNSDLTLSPRCDGHMAP